MSTGIKAMTQVQALMSATPLTCHESDSLNRAAQLMWEHDCGCVPVVDHLDHVVGIVTDRDICMGAYTQGRPLEEILVSSVCSRAVRTCAPDDSLDKAEGLMIKHQVRRLAVTEPDGHLVGVLSLSDLARHLQLAGPGKSDGMGPRALSLVMEAVSRTRQMLQRRDEKPAAKRAHADRGRRPKAV